MTLLPWRALFSIKKRWMISGTMIVQRMESRKRFTVFSLPITARMSVARYIKKMMQTAPYKSIWQSTLKYGTIIIQYENKDKR